MFNKDKIINDYDALVYESRESGVTYQAAIASLTDQYSAEFENTSVSGLDVPELIYDSIRYHVQTSRGARRQSLKDLFDLLGDKMDYAPGSKEHDRAHKKLSARFNRAYPLGAEDGMDKSLGLWTVDDVNNSVQSRLENLKKQGCAFAQFQAAASRAVKAISEGVGWA